MTNQPLFQNSDEHEAIYGGQNSEAANIEDAGRDRSTDLHEPVVPSAGAGLLGQTGGGISSGVVGGSHSAVGPAVGAEAFDNDTETDNSANTEGAGQI
jgi:hypothetical protein